MTRIALAVLLLLGTTVAVPALSPAPVSYRPAPTIDAVEGVGITVSSLDRAVRFYTEVLFFEVVATWEGAGAAHARLVGVPGARARTARLRLGEETVELTEYAGGGNRPIPPDSRSHDRWFQHVAIIVSDMDQASLWLARHGVEPVSLGPQRLPDSNPKAGGIRAFYFKDPDGHVLEILQFPPDKGDRRWRRPSERVFLGIDHTAIVVAHTGTSLAFYRDVLGLVVVGESDNRGIEQERLNNVPGAHLRITTLRAPRGPGVEFLEYLEPRDGRRLPWTPRSDDLVHWHTILATREPERALRRLGAAGFGLLAPEVVTVGPPLPFSAGALVRDPDGHALQLRRRQP
jgi:catechol 2,3-dioxygenase-like lactoylglutathione lyase family enzyme